MHGRFSGNGTLGSLTAGALLSVEVQVFDLYLNPVDTDVLQSLALTFSALGPSNISIPFSMAIKSSM